MKGLIKMIIEKLIIMIEIGLEKKMLKLPLEYRRD